MKDGVSARDAYQHALSYVKSNMPDLEKSFVKNIGFAVSFPHDVLSIHVLTTIQTGIEFRDASYILSPKNNRLLRTNMVIILSLGFSGLADGSNQKFAFVQLFFWHPKNVLITHCRYALNLVDTIKVEAGKSTLLTEGIKSPRETLFFLTPESEEEKEKKSGRKPPTAPTRNGSPAKVKTVGGKVLRNQTRRAVQDEVHQTALAKLIEHQRELHENLQTQGLAKYSEDGGGSSGKEGKGWKKFQSYKGEGALPSEVERLRVCSNPLS